MKIESMSNIEIESNQISNIKLNQISNIKSNQIKLNQIKSNIDIGCAKFLHKTICSDLPSQLSDHWHPF